MVYMILREMLHILKMLMTDRLSALWVVEIKEIIEEICLKLQHT